LNKTTVSYFEFVADRIFRLTVSVFKIFKYRYFCLVFLQEFQRFVKRFSLVIWNWTNNIRICCQIAILFIATLIVVYLLKYLTAAIAIVTVLKQQLIIVQQSQTQFWTYIITSSCILAESQATQQFYITTDFRFSEEFYNSILSYTITTSCLFFEKHLTIAIINIYGILFSIFFNSNTDSLLSVKDSSTTILIYNFFT